MPNFTDRKLAQIRVARGENIPVPPARKKPDNEESRMQQELMRTWAVECNARGIPERLLFAIGNGGKRSAVTGAIMKREGVRAGTSDLFLAVPRGRYHGLFLELKRPGGVPTEEQYKFILDANSQGYCALWRDNFSDAMTVIKTYLDFKAPEQIKV